MQIADARKNAKRYLSGHLIHNNAKRPNPDELVAVRYPQNRGEMILAPDVDALQEKLAKKIQQKARTRAN